MSIRMRQMIGAGLAIGLALVLWWRDAWPFNTSPPPLGDKPSLTTFLLADNATLGFVRLAVVVLALYVFVSVPALVIGGRWLKGFGTSGLTADDAASADEAIKTLTAQVDQLTQERDEALDRLTIAVSTAQRLLGHGDGGEA